MHKLVTVLLCPSQVLFVRDLLEPCGRAQAFGLPGFAVSRGHSHLSLKPPLSISLRFTLNLDQSADVQRDAWQKTRPELQTCEPPS